MDNYENQSNQPFSTTLDNDDIDWGDTEDIELESEEHDLFLQEDYIKPSNKDILPFRVSSPTSQRNGFNDKMTKSRSQKHNQNNIQHCSTSTENDQQTKIELFQVDDSGRDSPISSSVVYQLPNYQQFAGNLAPSSPTSVLMSFIIIIVILFVTIVPIIIFPPGSSVEDSSTNVINSDSSFTETQIEHADARCKCICPPHSQSINDDKLPEPTKKRRLYVGNTSPDQCNCNNIVQPHLLDTKIPLKDFCSKCECRYQSRNTTTIRRNVIFFIVILLGLGFYMFLQYLLKYLRITRRNLPRKLKWLSHQLTESG